MPIWRSLRTRLTLWYVGVLAVLLVLAWSATAGFLYLQLSEQLGRLAIQELETVEGLLYFDAAGQLRLREDYHNHPESKNVIERFLEVRSPDGTVLFRNERLEGRTLGGPNFAGEGIRGYSERTDRLSDGTPVRVVSRVHSLNGQRMLIRLGHSEEPLFDDLQDWLIAAAVVLPVMLLVAWFAGYGLARRALKPIETMARQAREITPRNLGARLPDADREDELGQLARVFNGTLGRLELAFEQLRRFTSDASHELRTPLAMIRSIGEVGLEQTSTSAGYREVIGSMLEEVNRLTSLVENLLTISRADAGHLQLRRSKFRAMELARDAADLLVIVAEERFQRLIVEGDEGPRIEGDRLFLRQALVNIIHNAIKYSPEGGTISVKVEEFAETQVAIEVRDDGPGIPAADRARIFDRFYRVDKARSRESGGAGLGLAIAKWAVEAHGGSIILTDDLRPGCAFRITLPVLAREQAAAPEA